MIRPSRRLVTRLIVLTVFGIAAILVWSEAISGFRGDQAQAVRLLASLLVLGFVGTSFMGVVTAVRLRSAGLILVSLPIFVVSALLGLFVFIGINADTSGVIS
jgi:hypothetical protein